MLQNGSDFGCPQASKIGNPKLENSQNQSWLNIKSLLRMNKFDCRITKIGENGRTTQNFKIGSDFGCC